MKKKQLILFYLLFSILLLMFIVNANKFLSIILFFLLQVSFLTFYYCNKKFLDEIKDKNENYFKEIDEKYENKFLEYKEKVNKESKDEKYTFYSNISHSIRMPISIILGYSNLLNSGIVKDDKQKIDYLYKISLKANQINDTLSILLSDVRGSDQKVNLFFEEVDLKDLINKLIIEVYDAIKKPSVKIELICLEDEVILNLDKNQITRVLYNLFENSIKYMGRPGKITVILSSFKEYIQIVFKDDGKGIESNEVSKIFDFKYQGSNKKYGDGIGLSIVKGIIVAHKGEIVAKSDIDKGMYTKITLPKNTKNDILENF